MTIKTQLALIVLLSLAFALLGSRAVFAFSTNSTANATSSSGQGIYVSIQKSSSYPSQSNNVTVLVQNNDGIAVSINGAIRLVGNGRLEFNLANMVPQLAPGHYTLTVEDTSTGQYATLGFDVLGANTQQSQTLVPNQQPSNYTQTVQQNQTQPAPFSALSNPIAGIIVAAATVMIILLYLLYILSANSA